MKKFIGSFMEEDIYLDDEEDKGAIALIDHLQFELEQSRERDIDLTWRNLNA